MYTKTEKWYISSNFAAWGSVYLVVAEEEQSSVVHQLSGLSVFGLWHVPKTQKHHNTVTQQQLLITQGMGQH